MKLNKNLIIIATFFVTSFFVSIFFSYHGYFVLYSDAPVHFSRFESIAEAFRHGQFPGPVNFIGPTTGQIFTTMYPWTTALIFILPIVLFTNPVVAMFIGYFVLNLLTMMNSYYLLKKYSNKTLAIMSGVFLYELNLYHLDDLFSRAALGEALAYAFLPLVLLGCKYLIEGSLLKGSLITGLGVGLIFNSHVLFSLLVVAYVIALELLRILTKKSSIKEFEAFVSSGVISVLIGAYSIVNLLNIFLKNELSTPSWGKIVTNTPKAYVEATLSNSMVITDGINFGLPMLVIMVALFVQIFRSNGGKWVKWTILSIIIFTLSLSWIPYEQLHLDKTILVNLQTAARLYCFVALFLSIALVIYLDGVSYNNLKKVSYVCMASFAFFGASAEILAYNGADNYAQISNQTKFSKNNYSTIVNRGTFADWDYRQKIVDSYGDGLYKLKLSNRENAFDATTFTVHTKRSGTALVPFFIFKGIDYKTYLNGKEIQVNKNCGVLSVNLKEGENQIRIVARPSFLNKLTMLVSVIAFIVICVWITLIKFRSLHGGLDAVKGGLKLS